MGIQNFPTALQPIIQQGFLERQFQDALRSRLGYRAIADKESFPIGIGETLTKTRAGLKAAVTTALAPSTNTNFDNGLTASGWGVEQYQLTINQYGDTIDLNMVTNRVGIVNQFMHNAYVNGEQAARSLDQLARNALFGAYTGGNTRVVTTLGAAGPTIAVDDIRGFRNVFVNGVLTPVSSSNTMSVTVGSSVYTLTGATADGSNVSGLASYGGISGTLTFSTNVTVANGTAGQPVISAVAPSIFRPNARTNTSTIIATDILTMANLLDAKAQLDLNAVPRTEDGFYHCYLDAKSMRQLFADADFKQLFQGATAENMWYRQGTAESPMLGLKFIQTTEAPVQNLNGVTIRRPIICGQGAIIEGDYAGQGASDVVDRDVAIVNEVDGVTMVTREPLDRLQQIIAQSWYWIGGFTVPTDTTANPTTIGTATNAALKRAVVIEHAG